MKFIDSYDDLKEGYLYHLSDGYLTHIMLCVKLAPSGIHGDLLISSDTHDTPKTDYFNMGHTVVSRVQVTDPEFHQTTYQFLEIGHKEEHPEYFL